MRTKGADTFIDILIDSFKIIGLLLMFLAAILVNLMFMGAALVRHFRPWTW